MSEVPDNIIDLMPYLEAVKAQEHRDQIVNAIMASAETKSNEPECCMHGVHLSQVCGQCFHEAHGRKD